MLVILALFVLAAACGPALQTGDETVEGTLPGETGGTGGEVEETEAGLDAPSDALGTPTTEIMEETEAPAVTATLVEEAPTEAAPEEPSAAAAEPTGPAGGTGTPACLSGPSQEEMIATGEQIYTNTCAACHGPEGQGAGSFPALANNDNITAEDATESLMKLLDPTVHPFIAQFDASDLAAVVTYTRMSFGNTATVICPEDLQTLIGGQ
jgi:mono/diheme cytochrome c family protein